MPDPRAARRGGEPLVADLAPDADPSRSPASRRATPTIVTRADGPAARRPRDSAPPADPLVDLCAVLRRIQALAAAAQQQLQRFPGGRRAARVEQLVGGVVAAAEVAAALVAEADRRGPGAR